MGKKSAKRGGGAKKSRMNGTKGGSPERNRRGVACGCKRLPSLKPTALGSQGRGQHVEKNRDKSTIAKNQKWGNLLKGDAIGKWGYGRRNHRMEGWVHLGSAESLRRGRGSSSNCKVIPQKERSKRREREMGMLKDGTQGGKAEARVTTGKTRDSVKKGMKNGLRKVSDKSERRSQFRGPTKVGSWLKQMRGR